MPNSPNSKMIAISKQNYENLKNCGRAGDSFNDVLDKIFENKTVPIPMGAGAVNAVAAAVAKEK